MEKLYLRSDITFNSIEDADDFLVIRGNACHYKKKNLNNEIVDDKSFNEFFKLYNDGRIKPYLNYNHNDDMVIGKIDTIVSNADEGLYIEAKVNKKVKYCNEWLIPNIESGVINSFSTEGWIKDGYDGIVEYGDGSYYVKDFILKAVAIVSTPADSDAKFTVANMMMAKKAVERSKWWLM